MYLEPLAFNALLGGIGQLFSMSRAFACPCLSPSSGSPQPNCPICGGKGHTWIAPIQGDAGISGAKVQREWAMSGMWEQGDVVLTLPSDSALYAMGQYDRVLMLNSSVSFSQPVADTNAKLNFAAAYVERVFWIDNGVLVEGAIPTVASDGSLVWPTALLPQTIAADGIGYGPNQMALDGILPSVLMPPAGKQFSISGRKVPEYFCFSELAQDRAHHHGSALPRRVVLRKFDLLGRR